VFLQQTAQNKSLSLYFSKCPSIFLRAFYNSKLLWLNLMHLLVAVHI